MSFRTLGANGPRVSSIGLGCMGMSDLYGPADEKESIATIHAALAAGVTLFDTGDYYGMGHNEMLLRRALEGRPREQAVLSVKFGAQRDPAGAWIGMDARPASVKNFLAYTLRRLGTDYVDVYRPGRLDPAVPIEDTVGAIAELIQAGHVRHVGLSEVGADTLRRAHRIHPVADLQIEYSLIARSVENEILPVARELGVGLTAYGVLSRGLLSGHWDAARPLAGDFRGTLPRFAKGNVERNLALVEQIRGIADEKRATVAQIAIAWALGRGDDVVPLVGARTRDRLAEALGARTVALGAADVARLEQALRPGAVAGTRYDAHQMQILDSERKGRG
jgi:aryl-alcohol dehydrogenase-like predicted oxidoreductase